MPKCECNSDTLEIINRLFDQSFSPAKEPPMATFSSTTVHRLQVQGFSAVDPAWLAEVSPWLRWSPALCAMFAAIGTATASPLILTALAGAPPFCALLPFFPFYFVYNYGIRFMVRARRLPPTAAPRPLASL